MTSKLNFFLYGAAFSVNLITLNVGIAFSWSSPTLPKLNNKNNLEDNPFGRVISPLEESWLASTLTLGATVGPCLGALLLNRIGRKRTILLFAVPIIVSQLIIAFTNDINLFYLGRFLIGLACGCCYSIVPVFVGEIAEDHNRGTLGCFIGITGTLGNLFCYVIGPYITIQMLSFVVLIVTAIFLVLFGAFIPESPIYLLMIKKEDEARLSLSKLRKTYTEKELQIMKFAVENSRRSQTNLTLNLILKSKALTKGLLICSCLIFLQQCAGITVIIAYMQSIFEASGSKMAPEISTMIVGVVLVITNIITSQLVDRLGRKILLLTSLTGTFISHSILGLYFYLKDNNYNDVVASLYWLPICCLILFMITFMLGLGPVIWPIIGEVFPPFFKNFATAFVTTFCMVLAFLLALFFPTMTLSLGMSYTIWCFATVCFVGIFFVWFVVPETKGKSFSEIQLLLENKKRMSKTLSDGNDGDELVI